MPIPTEEFVCSSGCCQRRFCPLTLAYARTVHKFQGMSAGPVDPGKIPNMFDVIVCDPDEKSAEGTALGLLYTAVSRATTLGDESGLNSAIYFQGSSLKPSRILDLTLKEGTNKEFELAIKRRKWVDHLQRQARKTEPLVQKAMARSEIIFRWAESSTVSYDDLYARIGDYKRHVSIPDRG